MIPSTSVVYSVSLSAVLTSNALSRLTTSFVVISIRVVHSASFVRYDAKRILSIMSHLKTRLSKSCREQLKSPVFLKVTVNSSKLLFYDDFDICSTLSKFEGCIEIKRIFHNMSHWKNKYYMQPYNVILYRAILLVN